MYLPIGKKYKHNSAVKLPKLQSRSKLQWNLNDKIDQYKWIEEIVQQKFNSESIKYDSERNVKNQQLDELQQKVKESKLKLTDLKDGEVHTIKNKLKGYRSTIRLRKPLGELLDHCDCKLFNKRKELDRLNHEKNQLSSAFASKRKILNKMQNRRNYSESYRLANHVKHHAFLLDKSEFQIRNYENLLNDFKTIIKNLTDESTHYASTLRILENEINEQNTLSSLLEKMRIPAAAKRPMVNKKQSQTMRKRIFGGPNKRKTSPNEVHHSEQFDTKTTHRNTENVTRKFYSVAKSANMSSQQTQSKLVNSKGNVNIRKNQCRIGKCGTPNAIQNRRCKEDVHEVAEQDAPNRKQSTVDLQTEQDNSSINERISGALFKIRSAIQHFDDLVRNASKERQKIK